MAKIGIFVPQDFLGDIYNLGAGAVGSVAGAVSGAYNQAAGAVSGLEQQVVKTVAGGAGAVSTGLASVGSQVQQVEQQTAGALTAVAKAVPLPAVAQQVEVSLANEVRQGQAAVAAAQQSSLAALSSLGTTTSSILSASGNAGLSAALNAIKIPTINLMAAIPTSPNVHDSSIGLQTLSDLGKKAGDISSVLQSDAGNIVNAAENLPGSVSLAAGSTVKALGSVIPSLPSAAEGAVSLATTPALAALGGAATAGEAALGTVTGAANTYSIGGRPIGNLLATNVETAAVLAAAGVVATPGILIDTGWNIGTDLAAIAKGVPLGQVKKSNLGEQSLDAFLGGVKGLTGFEANKELINQEATSLAQPAFKSNNLLLQGGAWGLTLGGELVNTTIQNPTSVTGEVGLLQVVPAAFDFIGSIGEKPTTGSVMGKTGGYKVTYVPTAKSACVGHVVGSKEAIAAGCS